jgi:hypothetical protein
MQPNLHANFVASSQQTRAGGLAIRTGLRGGVCVDVNDQVKSALQTLTNALAGTTTVATSAPTSAPATTSS